MANPKVSIVIPVFNVENYLVQCMDAAVNQTLRDIEITRVCKLCLFQFAQFIVSYRLSWRRGWTVRAGRCKMDKRKSAP